MVVAAYCLLILSLPLFPSQDGPLHMYYVRIFGLFVQHDPGLFAQYYRIGSYLPPYAVYYYLLLELSHVVGLLMADKLIMCGNIVLLAFGLRYLARRISEGGDIAAFLFLPLLLSWPLVMGFQNYMMSCGFGLFAAGLWARFDDNSTLLRQIGFVLLLYLMTLTHPIPLALLLLACGIDVVIRAGRKYRSQHPSSWSALFSRAICLAASLPAILYIRRFTEKSLVDKSESTWSVHHILHTAALFSRGTGLFAFTINSVWAIVYRAGVYLLFLAALLLSGLHARKRWRSRELDAASLWFVAVIAGILLLPLMPRVLNGSHFLAERLSIVLAMALVIASAGFLAQGRLRGRVVVVGSLLLSSMAIALGNSRFRPVANAILPLTRPADVPPGQIGVMLQPGHFVKRDLTYEPLLWAGAHYFRVNNLVLYNTAWLDGPQIPIKVAEGPNPLVATTEQRVPSELFDRHQFQPGALWNPNVSHFYMLEKSTPAIRPGDKGKTWQELDVLIPKLDISTCRPQQWYCLLPPR